MTALQRRLAHVDEPCVAVHAPTGSRCTRSDPHADDDIHTRGALRWGARDLPRRPAWLEHITARELIGERL